MPYGKMLQGLATKKGKRKVKRAANVTARLNKNMQMIKNSQTGNINESTGTVDSAKNKRRQSVAKRQKAKATRLMGKALASGTKKPTARKTKRQGVKSIRKAFGKHVAKIGGQTKRQAVKQYRKKGTKNPSVRGLTRK